MRKRGNVLCAILTKSKVRVDVRYSYSSAIARYKICWLRDLDLWPFNCEVLLTQYFEGTTSPPSLKIVRPSVHLLWCILCLTFSARDAFVRTNRRAIAMMFVRLSVRLSVRPSVCLSGTGMHCDQTVHFSADLSLWLDSPKFWAPWHQSMSTYSDLLPVVFFQFHLLIGSHICRVDWHNSGWPWVTLIPHRALSLR